MTRRAFADELEAAAANAANMSISEIQALLRRAALRVRNSQRVTLDQEVEDALSKVVAEMGEHRSDVMNTIVLDWMISYGRLPIHH